MSDDLVRLEGGAGDLATSTKPTIHFNFPEIDFKYGQVEGAIASLHNVAPAAMGTFKSRLKHFQRIGVVPSSPGKGQKLRYKVADAITWALCFEFTELGLPPEQTRDLLRLCVRELFRPFEGPVQNEDLIFVLHGNFLEWRLKPQGALKGEGATSFGTIPVSRVADRVFQSGRLPRVIMINLTHLKRELGKALDIKWQ